VTNGPEGHGPDADLPPDAVRIDPDWEDDELDDELGPRWWEQLTNPGPVGIAAFALAVLSYFSLSALDLSVEWITSNTDGPTIKRVAVGDIVVHLIVGGIALLLSLGAMYLDDEDDAGWVRAVSRAALVVAAVGLVLHGVGLGLDLHHEVSPGNGFFSG